MWRIKSNEELNRLIGKKIFINHIKSQRLAWFGHVHRMPDEWTSMPKRSLERPKNRWEDDVKNNVKDMRINNWKDCIGNRPKWNEVVEKAKTSLKL
jgi:ferredoxin-fold anticodon binding domain-containing protein